MAVQPGFWGIDIGDCALKAVRLQIIDNKVTATAFDYVEHPKLLSQPDSDPDQLTREALEKFLSRNPIKGDMVAIGVPGQSGLARFVKLPPVEEKKIDDIVKFEAKQQIPFPLEEVVWDYQKVSEGTVEGGFAIDTEIGLFAMKRDMISRYMNHFQSVNVEVHTIQMSPLALCNYVTYDILKKGGPDAPEAVPTAPGSKKKCVVLLDVGTAGSNLIITDGGKIIWQRPIPIGGNNFTRALIKELKLTFAKAEHLKRNAARSPELASILRALKPVLTDFVGEVQRSLGYFTNTHRDAQVDYLIGLGSAFKLPGLHKYLGDKLSLKVEKPARFNRLAGEAVTSAPVFTENILTFPVAFGLALQSLGVARLRTNLLPPEIALDRKIRAKKPWAVAAAALLMIGTGVLAYGYSVPYAAVNDKKIPDAFKVANAANAEAKKVELDIGAEQTKVFTAIGSIQAILSGKGERPNWLRINEYINSCLPVPGEKGNMKGDQAILWNNSDGAAGGSLAATKAYYERIQKAIDSKNVPPDDLRQYLAAVDIEAVHCRYVTDMPAFFKNVKTYSKSYVGDEQTSFTGLEDPERSEILKDPPVFTKGPAWVFEIRGTTWYEQGTIKGPEFLKRTLLPNLKQMSKASPDSEIRGNVSHIFLYHTWKDEEPRQDTYHFIHDSLINYLAPGEPIADGGKPPVGWRAVMQGNTGAAASNPAAGAPTGNPYLRSSITPAAGKDNNPLPMAKKEDPMAPKAAKKPRYEFVILFVWKEPAPSEAYVKPGEKKP
ncbi:MAG: type IV pilus assembly protein PilM [Planctomycetes bacterium]|nr:type IV pilus assembly protein PilM [Planctomycetota bacterium]